MTGDDARRTMARIADARLARRAELPGEPPTPAPALERGDTPFVTGDRVLDSRGGREGAVSHVGPTDTRGAFLVFVRFDDGSSGARDPWELVRRPTPPPARA